MVESFARRHDPRAAARVLCTSAHRNRYSSAGTWLRALGAPAPCITDPAPEEEVTRGWRDGEGFTPRSEHRESIPLGFELVNHP
jgi:hypothetical protein